MSSPLSELLKLPADQRAELAMALWDSLSEAEGVSELDMTADELASWIAAGTITWRGPSLQSPGARSAASCWIESDPQDRGPGPRPKPNS